MLPVCRGHVSVAATSLQLAQARIVVGLPEQNFPEYDLMRLCEGKEPDHNRFTSKR
jgi:hypothetical protein